MTSGPSRIPQNEQFTGWTPQEYGYYGQPPSDWTGPEMPYHHASLETGRSEIILIAVGILVLVSVFGIILIVFAGLSPAKASLDLKGERNTAAWGGHWYQEAKRAVEPYQDHVIVGAARRTSIAFADEVRRGIDTLKDQTLAAVKPGDDDLDGGPIGETLQSLRRMSADLTARVLNPSAAKQASRKSSVSETRYAFPPTEADTPMTTAWREVSFDGGMRRRSSRVAFDVEAQDSDFSDDL